MKRREFIKGLAGVVIGIALPVGVIQKGLAVISDNPKKVEFTLSKIETIERMDGARILRGLATQKGYKEDRCLYFGFHIPDKYEYDKDCQKAVMDDINREITQAFLKRFT